MTFRHWALPLACLSSIACLSTVGDPVDSGTPSTLDGGTNTEDSGVLPDGGVLPGTDAGEVSDAGSTTDGGPGTSTDAGSTPDAGPPPVDDGGVYGFDARLPNPTCIAPAPPPIVTTVASRRVFTKLSFAQPLGLYNAPQEPDRNFVIEREGRVRAFPNTQDAGGDVVTTVLDIRAKVNTTEEGGLLGFAFHPDWATNHQAFLSYSETRAAANTLRMVISRFTSTDNGLTLDPASEQVILKLDKPAANHNGGSIAFGPDGYLYAGYGDGGGGGDTFRTGSRLSTLLSKMIRIDVNVPAAEKYAIPSTNPYASTGVVCNRDATAWDVMPTTVRCAEIYATGFRNPSRWSFDTANGELWVGDVGQGLWEEVDKVVMGGNYGWSIREGKHCYNAASCSTAGLIDPEVEYDHSVGQSMTGGFVYRGNTISSLVGKFIYSDYVTSPIYAVNYVNGVPEPQLLVARASGNIAAFGQLLDGEVYPLDISGGGIYKLVPAGSPPPDTFPKTLSATGCFEPSDPRQPVAAMVPYGVRAQLWSDGADKARYFAIPDGSKITPLADGDFDLPNGSVAAKTFFLQGKRIETRLFMRHSSGEWAGYTYEWNDAETEATLLPSGKSKTVGSQTWVYPSRAQCLGCHTSAAGRTLGLEAGQLNFSYLYPTGRVRNQLATLSGLGFFTAAVPSVTPLVDPFGGDPIEARARSYLHSNCSNCHRSGAGQGPQDFRSSLTTAQTNSCNVSPSNGDLGVPNAKLFVPSDPTHSLISLRMKALDSNRMPRLGSSVVHVEGTALIDGWISSMATCPP